MAVLVIDLPANVMRKAGNRRRGENDEPQRKKNIIDNVKQTLYLLLDI